VGNGCEIPAQGRDFAPCVVHGASLISASTSNSEMPG
jgi:hypothetical protein